MNTATRLRQGATIHCLACNKELPRDDFGDAPPYKDGTPRKKPRCRSCSSKQARERAERLSEETILRVEAPIRAAQRLVRENPVVLAEVIRRFHYEYIPLLNEERDKMIKARKRYTKKIRTRTNARRAANKKKAASASHS